MCSSIVPRASRSPRPHVLTTALVAASLALAFPPLHAQSPADRAELERFRDSVGATSDSSGLLELERRMIEST
ncbi:MAG: hypothetical protein L0214_08585, partial [candidate division NC10 bacterium]|nr:hypothetical protein [candidate division NC10 bacterium]